MNSGAADIAAKPELGNRKNGKHGKNIFGAL